MRMVALANQLQELIRHKFPGVIVRQNLCVPNDGDVPVFDVFMFPDGRVDEFTEYVITEFPGLAEKAKLPEVLLMEHGVTATLKLYPEIAKYKAPITKATPARRLRRRTG